MQIALVTDAWHPQVNGVVHTWSYVQRELAALGHQLHVICADGSRGVKAPGEPELLLSTEPQRHLQRRLRALAASGAQPLEALHIATEGPLGWAARRLAQQRRWPFTTSYHTRFPEYLRARFGIPPRLTYAVVRRFHAQSKTVLVATEAMRKELLAHGFERVRVWSRGVDAERFKPGARDALELPRPIFLYAGRVAPEKNLDAFLSLDLPGSKVIVGDGPDEKRLREKFAGGHHSNIHWLGRRPHHALAPLYDAADVFVFPSRTDTFGLVMLEAMACGCPVAAFPVTGPIDVVTPGLTGVLDEDLQRACLQALQLNRLQIRAHALTRSWRSIAQQLTETVVPLPRA